MNARFFLLALLFAACDSGDGVTSSIRAAQVGRIEGEVVWRQGPVPALAELPIGHHRDTCGNTAPDESLRVGAGGGVKNAVVSVEAPPAIGLMLPPPLVARFEVRGCRIGPRVAVGQYRSHVELLNHDSLVYAFEARAGTTRVFTQTLPFGIRPIQKPLDRVGILELRDTVGYGWMRAWLHVVQLPEHVAITNDTGRFTLTAVPNGRHRLTVWHEPWGKLGAPVEQSREVHVPPGGIVHARFELGPEGTLPE